MEQQLELAVDVCKTTRAHIKIRQACCSNTLCLYATFIYLHIPACNQW